MKKYNSVRWGNEDNFLSTYCRDAYNTNENNFWVADAIDISEDLVSWIKLNDLEKEIFLKASVILQMIDKNQASVGMNKLASMSFSDYEEMVYMFQGGMETVHSKSYNRINATLTTSKVEEIWVDWAENNEAVQNVVGFLFSKIDEVTKEKTLPNYLKTIAYSNASERFLFFILFYPFLRFARVENKMTKTAEIIRLILRDESTHSAFGGGIFNYYYEGNDELHQLTDAQKDDIDNTLIQDISKVYELAINLVDELYTPFGEEYKQEVIRYANYNFNRYARSLGFTNVFNEEDTVIRGAILEELSSKDINYDNFSMTGDKYFMMEAKPFNDDNLNIVYQALDSGSDLVPKLI